MKQEELHSLILKYMIDENEENGYSTTTIYDDSPNLFSELWGGKEPRKKMNWLYLSRMKFCVG